MACGWWFRFFSGLTEVLGTGTWFWGQWGYLLRRNLGWEIVTHSSFTALCRARSNASQVDRPGILTGERGARGPSSNGMIWQCNYICWYQNDGWHRCWMLRRLWRVRNLGTLEELCRKTTWKESPPLRMMPWGELRSQGELVAVGVSCCWWQHCLSRLWSGYFAACFMNIFLSRKQCKNLYGLSWVRARKSRRKWLFDQLPRPGWQGGGRWKPGRQGDTFWIEFWTAMQVMQVHPRCIVVIVCHSNCHSTSVFKSWARKIQSLALAQRNDRLAANSVQALLAQVSGEPSECAEVGCNMHPWSLSCLRTPLFSGGCWLLCTSPCPHTQCKFYYLAWT